VQKQELVYTKLSNSKYMPKASKGNMQKLISCNTRGCKIETSFGGVPMAIGRYRRRTILAGCACDMQK